MGSSDEKQAGVCISGNLAVCAFIERSHLFKGLEKKDLESLYSTGRLLQYQAGEVIIREGDVGSEMFVVMTGTVRVVTGTKQAPVELAQLKRGAFFGEVSLLTGRPRTATVLAIDDVELVAFGKQDMEPILRKDPRVRKLMKVVVEGRVRTAIEKSKGPS
jgi:CRP-like cAMP-binding protein